MTQKVILSNIPEWLQREWGTGEETEALFIDDVEGGRFSIPCVRFPESPPLDVYHFEIMGLGIKFQILQST